MNMQKRTKENSAQAKLGRLSSKVYEDAQADTHAQAQLQAQVQAEAEAQALLQAGPFARPTGNVSLHQNAPDNWKFAVVGCGSNGFGQLFVNDIMSSKLQHIPLPSNKKKPDCEIEQISAGSSVSAAVMSNGGGLYMWGTSGTSNYRTPLPMKIDPRCVVKQVSCGESHTAFISQTGKVFTIGSGEHGALGHGNKTTLTTPKIVSALAKLTCLQVSCGPYHTAFIAGEESEIGFVRVPPSAAPVNVYEEWEGSPDGRFDRAQDGSLLCARLFMCGIGKTGQLGLGDKSDMIKSPREVKWFTDNGHRVAKVSCGMHHTAVIAVPVHAMRMFITTVFTFGWGEHGRLGHGTENSCKIPTEVAFPEPFHAIDISAGEQHTLATSGRDNGCYAWGNNSFGQCAAGSPSSAEFSLTPNRVPIPEGIRVMSVTAGGRHSAAISACEKLLLWGWGEEGQLGNGTEKDSWLPRPVRLPTVMGQKCIPMAAALGMCHTIIAVRNKNYVYSPMVEDVEVEQVEAEKEEEESIYLPIVSNTCNTAVAPAFSCALSPAPILKDAVTRKQTVLITEENIEEEEVKPIQSLKDILASRESRENEKRDLNTVMGRYSSDPEPVHVPDAEPEVVEPIEKKVDPVVIINDELCELDVKEEGKEIVNSKPALSNDQPSTKDKHFDRYFYKDGQNLDNCFVANSARRAELRKQKKSSAPEPPPSSNKKSAYPRRSSK